MRLPDRAAYALLDLRVLAIKLSHRITDPACMMHRKPTTALARWWHRINHGRACRECMDIRAKSRPCKRHDHCVLVEHAPTTPCFVLR